MNRYEQYQWAKYGPPPEPVEKPRKGIDWANIIKRRSRWGTLHIPELGKSEAVRWAEANIDEFERAMEGFPFRYVPNPTIPQNEIQWNTPFGVVRCKASRHPSAMRGWVFTDG